MKIRSFKNQRQDYSIITLITLSAVLMALTACTSQPQVLWTEQAGTPSDDFAYAVAVDAEGNAYVAGSTSGSFEGNTNAGFRDVVLVKYDAGGTKLWSRQIGTPSWEEAYAVAVDSFGNTYVAGYTYGGIDGNVSSGQYDLFLVKYDAGGTKLWSRQAGSSGNDYAYSISTDKDGNAYVAGYTYGGIEGANAGSADLFLVKYDAGGTKLWSRQIGSPADDIAYSISTDKDGNAYVAGYTGGGIDGNTNSGSWDIFLVKYDAGGTKLWSRQIGTPSWDEAWAAATDKDGNAYVTGYTGGRLDNNDSKGAFDIFLAKYDTDGNKLWATQTGTPENDYAHAVSVDKDGNACVGGYTEGGIKGFTNKGGADLLLAKFSTGGKRQWATQIGTQGGDYTFSIAADTAGNIYSAGETTGSLTGTNQGAYDLFVLKLAEPKQGGFKGLLKKLGIGK